MAGPTNPYRSWRGALELTLGDLPYAVNVEFYTRVKKTRNESFKGVDEAGIPVERRIFDHNGEQIDEALKGVKVGPHEFRVVDPEAIDKINAGTKTEVAKVSKLSPLDTIALDLAIDRFAIRPDSDTAGADSAVQIVWNGLRETGLALTTQISMSGGHDSILVVYATDDGLWGALLPFEEELYPLPTHEFEENEQAAGLFAASALAQDAEPFDHASFKSEYRARRQTAIEQALAGEKIEVDVPPTEAKSQPDLMAALAASTKQAKARKAKKPAKKAKKVAA